MSLHALIKEIKQAVPDDDMSDATAVTIAWHVINNPHLFAGPIRKSFDPAKPIYVDSLPHIMGSGIEAAIEDALNETRELTRTLKRMH
jgi:hypothetical protein